MRKVVAGLFMTLDGVVESPGTWQEHFDEEMGEAMMEQLTSQDAVLLGRVTYQEWASYWPTATDEPFASFINSTPKYVFSTTLESVAAWKNSTLMKGDLAQEIAKLKQLPGKNIGTAGSPTLVYSLLEQGLLDELILLVHPVVAGHGKRLFQDGGSLKRLNLLFQKRPGREPSSSPISRESLRSLAKQKLRNKRTSLLFPKSCGTPDCT
jgi:dihydrofolate reductase